MEPKLTDDRNDKMNTRDAEQSVKSRMYHSAEGWPRDPLDDERQEGGGPRGGGSDEGFRPSRDSGMPNLEKSDGFGSRFQMPGPDMSEKYRDKPFQDDELSALAGGSGASSVEGFVDVQTSCQQIQHLVQRIRENLQNAEQEELEGLLREGAELLSVHWKQLASTASDQVLALKEGVRENPYRSLFRVLKVGMALGQVVG